TFDQSHNGKNVHIISRDFNYVGYEPYKKSGIIELPTWASLVDIEDIHVFLNGYLLPKERTHLFRSFKYLTLEGKTVLAVDLDTDIVKGENIAVLISSDYEMVEYNRQLSDGDKIIELVNKDYPFSTKYC